MDFISSSKQEWGMLIVITVNGDYGNMSKCKGDRKKALLGQEVPLEQPLALVIMPWQKADTAWLLDQSGWAAAKNSCYSLHVN